MHVEQARETLGDESYAQLPGYIGDGNNKISHVDLEERKDEYAKGVDKVWKIPKSEQSTSGFDVLAVMDGGIRIK